LGKLFIAQKQGEKAIPVLTKAVEVEPGSADAQHYLGESYLQIKKGSIAVGHLNQALRLAPIEKAEIHLRLAALYNGAGLKGKAAEEYKLFLEKVPKHPEREKIKNYIKENSSK
jgi:tetratricopeptide (TPR) repeat protein